MLRTAITLRVTAPARDTARVSVRRNQFSVGRPVEFDGPSPRVGVVEYALGAVGGEIVNGLCEFARRRRLEIDAIEASVIGELDHELTYLEVIGESGEPRISKVSIKVFIASSDELVVRALFDHMLDRLPLFCTLRASVHLTTELIFTS
jgi:hypothetical protein